jgi:8-oxo-dGTP diphosphatase
MIEVSCALIRNEDDEILVVQRGGSSDHPLKWEFPGGKIKEGESQEDCVIREIKEELSMDIIICDKLSAVEHDYGHKQVRLYPFICDTLIDLPVLQEHNNFKWIEVKGLLEVDFSEADIPVAMEYFSLAGVDDVVNTKDKVSDSVDGNRIREMLTGPISMDACKLIADSAVENTAVLKVLVDFSMSDDKTLAFRSSWTITKAVDKLNEIAEPWNGLFIRALPELDNESVIRSFLKVINLADYTTFSEKEHGIIAQCCFSWLNSGTSAIAIKAYSMEALYRLTQIYTELREELSSSINRVSEDGSAGIKARGKYINERIRKDKIKEKNGQ